MILTVGIDCSISPSVYVAYRNLRRSDDCPSFGWGDFTRGRVYNTTIAYRPGFLSTSLCTGEPQGGYRGFAALNVTELQYPTSYNGTCMGLNIELEKTTNGPYLSMPPDLTALDPDWSTCDAVYWGAFDPPIALHTATALAPDPGSKSPPTPAPGSPIAPPHAPATPTPLVSPVDPGRHSSAPNAASQDPKQQNPNSPNPIKSSATPPRPDPTSLIIDPASDNSGNPVASAALADPPRGSKVAQGNSKATSDPQSSDPQRGGEVSEGDSGVGLGNGNKAEPSSNPANKADQSPADPAQPLPSIGGQQIQAAKGGGIIVASTTLQPGVQTTIDGTALSVDKDHVVLASSTISLVPPPADPIITLINGDTLSAGGQAAIVSGGTVALAANDALVVNGKTSPLPPPPTPILTVAGQTLTPAPAGFAIGGQSVLPGGSAVTVDGSTFSIASEGNALIVNGKTSPLPPPPPPPTAILTLAGQTITPAPTGFAIGGQSVLPGGPAVTVDGSTFSLASASGSNALIVNGKITPLPWTPLSVFTVGSQIFTAAPGGFEIGTQSVSPGAPAVTVDGTLISLDSSQLIIGTSTVPLGSAAQTLDGALPSLILYGGGGGAKATSGSSNTSDVAPFLGGGGSSRVGIGMVVFALVVDMGIAMVVLGLG